ncbi:unnamed protein product [Linum tenue]|uniref:RanBD1 domain-containing protein n=1 Tax=Linum tenue TaxID=586396 RepID=A0AAV0Q0G5_9ROSI|nr:unnamed protein product [Linum tenue]
MWSTCKLQTNERGAHGPSNPALRQNEIQRLSLKVTYPQHWTAVVQPQKKEKKHQKQKKINESQVSPESENEKRTVPLKLKSKALKFLCAYFLVAYSLFDLSLKGQRKSIMRGTKRLATSSSELAPESNDTGMRTKRAMRSFSDVHKAVTSQKQFKTATPSLDVQRAELSRQHVRALNSQFASWVQKQLKNHPDELWEDGVHDYLTHASSIMQKFSDVVNWLKANGAKGGPGAESSASDKKPSPDTNKINENNLSNERPPAFASTSTSFTTAALPPAIFSYNQSSISGGQSSATTKDNASDDAADGDELPQPGSPSVKKVEEKGVAIVHQVKCKLYVKSIDPADKDTWKDKGPGQLSIKCAEGVSKGTKESSPTLIIRNDLGKVLLNALLYPGIKTSLQKNSVVAIFHVAVNIYADDSGSNESVAARTFLIRTKTEDDRDKLATAIREYAPES